MYNFNFFPFFNGNNTIQIKQTRNHDCRLNILEISKITIADEISYSTTRAMDF